jgi:hypothetical protein
MLNALYQKYGDPLKVDQLSAVADKVRIVKSVMEDNVKQALKNTVILEEVEAKTGYK